MIIDRLSIRNFGRLRELSVDLHPGLNLIWGPNEAGKSTLAAALLTLLFEDPTDPRAAARWWQSWGGARLFELQMTFQAGGEHWLLHKDFEQRTALLRNLTSREEYAEPAEVQAQVAARLGLDSQAVYQSTAAVRQEQIVQLQEGRRVGELLQQALSGAGAAVSADVVLQRLDVAARRLREGEGESAGGGPDLPSVSRHLTALRQREAQAAQTVAQAEATHRRLQACGREHATLEAELAELSALVQWAETRQNLEQRRDLLQQEVASLQQRLDHAEQLQVRLAQLQEQVERLPQVTVEQALGVRQTQQAAEEAEHQTQAAAALVSELEARHAELSARAAPAESQEAAEQMLTAGVGLREETVRLAAEVAQERESYAEADRALRTDRERRRLRAATLAMGLLFALAGLLTGRGVHWGFYLMMAPGAALVLWSALIRCAPRPRDLREAAAAAQQRLVAAEAESAAAQARLADLLERAGAASIPELTHMVQDGTAARVARDRELSQVQSRLESAVAQRQEASHRAERFRQAAERMLGTSFASVQEMEDTARRRAELLSAWETSRGELDGALLGGEQQLREQLETQRSALEEVRERLHAPELADAQTDPAQLGSLRQTWERKRQQRERLVHDQAESEALVRSAPYDEEDLGALRAQIAEAERAQERLERRLRVLQITLQFLRQARELTLRGATEVLAPAVAELFAQLTEGRYSQVEVDGDTLEPVAYSPAKRGRAELPPDLSVATREQLYLAARLGLVKLLWPQEGPPLLLDDPLVNFDTQRHQAACGLLRSFARDRQMLLLSCSDRAAPFADQVLQLAASPAEVTTSVAGQEGESPAAGK